MTHRTTTPDPLFWRLLKALLAVACLVPFLLPSMLPLTDLPGHLARLHILLDGEHSKYLSLYYEARLRLVPNLGSDLLMLGLSRVMSLDAASRLILGAAILGSAWGTLSISRQLHGARQSIALLAFVFVFNWFLLWGFLNYLLGLGMALPMVALWLQRLRDEEDRLCKPEPWFHLLFAGLAALLWVCHLVAFGIYLILVGALTLHAAWHSFTGRGRLANSLCATLLRLLHCLPALALTGWYLATGEGQTITTWSTWQTKIISLIGPFRLYYRFFDLATAIGVCGAIGLGLVTRRLRVHHGALLATALIFAVYLAMPYTLSSSALADQRLTVPLALSGVAALAWTERAGLRLRAVTGLVIAALAFLRIGALTRDWLQADRVYAEHLKALDHVPQGARIASFAVVPCSPSIPVATLANFQAYAVLKRDAFVNVLFDVPLYQVMRVRYNRDTQLFRNPSQLVYPRECAIDLPTPYALEARLAYIPDQRFDYVWIVGTSLLRHTPRPNWAPVYRDADSILYRVAPWPGP